MPTIKANGINMYYEEQGKGESLVLIAGFGGDTTLWTWPIPWFSKEYRVVAFDNRGAGRSDKPDTPYTMEMMAADTAGLLEAIHIGAAHIYGVSMGGMIAQHFALRYPEKVMTLILGCTTCGAPHGIPAAAESAASFNALFDPAHFQKLTPIERMREWIPFMFSQTFVDQNPSAVEEAAHIGAQYPMPLHALARQGEAVAGHNTYDRLPEIRVPTLVIAGDADRMLPSANSALLASRIARRRISDGEGYGALVLCGSARTGQWCSSGFSQAA